MCGAARAPGWELTGTTPALASCSGLCTRLCREHSSDVTENALHCCFGFFLSFALIYFPQKSFPSEYVNLLQQ